MPRGVPRTPRTPAHELAAQLNTVLDNTVLDPGEPDTTLDPQPDEPPVIPAPTDPTPTRPAPEHVLSPEQRRIRDLENQLALERGKKDPEPELEPPAEDGENVVIHFVADGITALGHNWYRGQELEFTVGSPAYRDTCDRHGWSWLSLRDDEAAQVAKYGEVKFRPGPWPGQDYLDASTAAYEPLRPLRGDGKVERPSEDDLRRAALAEAKRRRAAPRLPIR